MFDFIDEIQFDRAVFYHFNPIPLPQPFKDGTGGMGKFAPEQGYIELYDQEGACAHLSVGTNFVKHILPMILTGERKTYNEWREELYWRIRNAGFQSEQAVEVGQLDLLMLDLLAQRYELPLHRFMGADKNWAAAYKGGGSLLLEDSELVEDMVRYVEEGYNTIKFKVGSGSGKDIERDVRRLEKVRKAVGEMVEIAVDANQRWGVEDASQFAQMIKPFHPAWFEEPIHAHDMNGIKVLKEKNIGIPIAFGESMRIAFAYETYAEKGVDHLQPSVGRMSKMDDLLKIRDLSRQKGIRFSSGGRIYLNAIFGCQYAEDELIEYHEPISRPVGNYILFQPEEKNGRFYCQDDIPGNPQRMDLVKLEKNGLLKSKKIFYTLA